MDAFDILNALESYYAADRLIDHSFFCVCVSLQRKQLGTQTAI